MTEHMRDGAGAGAGMMGGMGGHMIRLVIDDAKIDQLKKDLGITAAQEAGWAKYVEVLKTAAESSKSMHEGMDPTAVRQMALADRRAFMTKMHEQHQNQFETVAAAAEQLYASLDERQKARADQVLPGLASSGGCLG
jgi:hypothetical protein